MNNNLITKNNLEVTEDVYLTALRLQLNERTSKDFKTWTNYVSSLKGKDDYEYQLNLIGMERAYNDNKGEKEMSNVLNNNNEVKFQEWLNFVGAKELHADMTEEQLKGWYMTMGGVDYKQRQAKLELETILVFLKNEEDLCKLSIMDAETEEEVILNNYRFDESKDKKSVNIYDRNNIVTFNFTDDSKFEELDDEERLFIIDGKILHFEEIGGVIND